MKKYLAILLILALSVTVLAACSAQPAGGPSQQGGDAVVPDSPPAKNETPPENTPEPSAEAPAQPAGDGSLQSIKDKGYFVLGLDDSFPPMGYRDENNEIVGFDIDLARACAEKMGVEVQLHPLVWDFIAEELNGGKCDVIWNGCTITEERKEKFDFTKPYLVNTQVVVVLEGSPYKTLADLKDKKLGIQAGSSANDALDANAEFKASLKEVRSYENNDQALTDLAAKRTECVALDVTVFEHYQGLKPGVYRRLDQDLGAEEFGIGVRKSDVTFREALQKALDECLAEGTTAKIAEKWLGNTAALPK